MIRTDSATAQRTQILIIKLSSLGDLFHALPVVHSLKTQLQADVDWVTQPEYQQLVRCFTDVRNVYTFPRRDFLKDVWMYRRAVRQRQYDYIFDMQGLLKSAVAARLARGSQVIGPSWQREGAFLLYGAVAGTRDKERHAVDEGLDFVRHLGLSVEEAQFPVEFPPYALPKQDIGPSVAFVPCSRWETKNWPIEHFIRVGQQLGRTIPGLTVYVLGGPADQVPCHALEQGLTDVSVRNLCGQTSLLEMGSVLGQMDAVLTVDSGPMHIASALGVPVVAVFGATSPLRTGPYGLRQKVFQQNDLSCCPCLSRTCQRGDLACMTGLRPEPVAEYLITLLQ